MCIIVSYVLFISLSHNGHTQVYTPNGTSMGLSVFVGLTDRRTHADYATAVEIGRIYQ